MNINIKLEKIPSLNPVDWGLMGISTSGLIDRHILERQDVSQIMNGIGGVGAFVCMCANLYLAIKIIWYVVATLSLAMSK